MELGAGSATDGNSDTDTLSNIENVIGSAYADIITGSTGDNIVSSGGGNDDIDLDDGDDTYIYTLGQDQVDGGDGVDTVDMSGFAYAVWINLATTYWDVQTRDSSDFPLGRGVYWQI